MDKLILLALIGIGALLLLAWFTTLERQGRGHVIVGIILGEVVLEAFLFVNQTDVSSTLFYPKFAGQNIRLPQVLIPLALLARVLAGRRWNRVTGAGALWLAFFAWYGASFVLGVINGNPLQIALFDAKAIIYIGGGYLLVAGTPARQLVNRRTLGVWTGVMAGCALALLVINFTQTSIQAHLPLLDLRELAFGSDASGSIAALGIILLVVEIVRGDPRLWVTASAALLILSPLGGTQRAAIIEMATIVSLLVLCTFGRLWRRRVHLTPTQTGAVLAVAGAVVLAAVVFPSTGASSNPVATRIASTFESEGKQQSADARRLLWRESKALATAKPVVGWGLGKQALLRQVFPLPAVLASSHNVWLDLMIRSGLIGLVLFALAMIATLLQAAGVWRRARDSALAALALGGALAAIGLLAKGEVESLFDQFRLAVIFGCALGAIASAARAVDEGETANTGTSETGAPADAGALTPVAVPQVFVVSTTSER